MKRVLITGGSGFIGSHLVKLLMVDYTVVVLDNFSSGCSSNLEGLDCELIEGSVTDEKLVRTLIKDTQYVFHLAAMVSVAQSMAEPGRCVETNIGGLLNVLKSCVEHDVAKVVFASSAAVYGNTEISPKSESCLPEPQSPYAITKLDGEHYLRMFGKEHGLKSAALRFFNVYGPRQNPNGPYASAIPIFIKQALENDPIKIFGDGGQTRDFVHVSDVVRGLRYAAECDHFSGATNLASGMSTSLNDLITVILKKCRSKSDAEYLEPRAGDIRHSLACVRRAKEFGFESEVTLEEGIQALISGN